MGVGELVARVVGAVIGGTGGVPAGNGAVGLAWGAGVISRGISE